jgi:hypothetical protein
VIVGCLPRTGQPCERARAKLLPNRMERVACNHTHAHTHTHNHTGTHNTHPHTYLVRYTQMHIDPTLSTLCVHTHTHTHTRDY